MNDVRRRHNRPENDQRSNSTQSFHLLRSSPRWECRPVDAILLRSGTTEEEGEVWR